ncbi:MAG: hypothetical protein ABJF10_17595 [Chthoniobacter sp.]|uniref:hypothetical protein n=1 Tax=Chthoniobacter sp. TaxID=2510640 RepID=UPI0032A4D8C5
MKTVILAFLVLVWSVSAFAQGTDQQWQAKAIEKYPALAVKDSDFNKRFIAEYNKRHSANAPLLKDPRWPLLLADELAAIPAPASKSVRAPAPTPGAKASENALSGWWTDLSDDGRFFFQLLGFLFGVVVIAIVLENIARRWRWRRMRADCGKYLALAQESGDLPIVATNVLLPRGEIPFYCAASALFETRTVVHHRPGYIWHATSHLYLSFPGRSYGRDRMTKIDTGTLTVTNRRLIYDGTGNDRVIQIDEIIAVKCGRDAVEISVENRDRSMIFAAANPLILHGIIRYVAYVRASSDSFA